MLCPLYLGCLIHPQGINNGNQTPGSSPILSVCRTKWTIRYDLGMAILIIAYSQEVSERYDTSFNLNKVIWVEQMP